MLRNTTFNEYLNQVRQSIEVQLSILVSAHQNIDLILVGYILNDEFLSHLLLTVKTYVSKGCAPDLFNKIIKSTIIHFWVNLFDNVLITDFLKEIDDALMPWVERLISHEGSSVNCHTLLIESNVE
jgi:hypothetical protein